LLREIVASRWKPRHIQPAQGTSQRRRSRNDARLPSRRTRLACAQSPSAILENQKKTRTAQSNARRDDNAHAMTRSPSRRTRLTCAQSPSANPENPTKTRTFGAQRGFRCFSAMRVYRPAGRVCATRNLPGCPRRTKQKTHPEGCISLGVAPSPLGKNRAAGHPGLSLSLSLYIYIYFPEK